MEAAVVAISVEDKDKTPAEWHEYWQKELSAASKRLRKYRKQGDAIVKRYLDERDGGNHSSRLNLFYKNVSTTLSMLYGQTPRIDVAREFHDPDDDVARVAGYLLERMLGSEAKGAFADCLTNTLQDRLLPGMGTARVRYEFETEKTVVLDPTTFQPVNSEKVVNERAPVDYLYWKDVVWGWGRTWTEVPFWGFRSWLDKDEVIERFGEKIANNLQYKKQTPSGGEQGDMGGDEQRDSVQKAEIWEFWKKDCRRVFWFSEGAELILDIQDDPLGLEGFFPIPRPMMANCTTSLYIPRADFVIAQDLYNEIDTLQTRISKITDAIKVVGVYDQSAGNSVGRMLKEGIENDMIPVENWAMFAEKGALKGLIDWFPVETVVGVLQTLTQIQQQKMEQLYEIVGMSDIMRGGNTQQYTSDGTNQLKAKMGSISIQALQEEFARFASDLESLKAEIIGKHFSKESIVKQANAGFVPEADKMLVAPALDLMKSQDVKWRINIKPESIAMVDYAQLKSERTEFLMAMSQYIQSAQAAAKEIPGSLPILLELMKWGMQGFKGSDYLEGTFDQAIDLAKKGAMQPPPEQQGPSPEQMKMQIEQLKMQAQQQKQQGEMQKMQMKSQADMANIQAKIQGEIVKIQTDAERDLTLEQTQAQNRLMEIARDLEASLSEIQANMTADITVEEAQARFDIASQESEHSYTMAEIAAQNRGRNA